MIDFERTVLSQFASAKTLVSYLESLNFAVDPRNDIEYFYHDFWNIRTAVGIGLDFWGKVVGVGRKLKISVRSEAFGFQESSGSIKDYFPRPFNDAPFYSGQVTSEYIILVDDAYRQLIMVKALANISINTIPNYNILLRLLFSDRGLAWAEDGLDMTMTLHFDFKLSDFEISMIRDENVLSRPAGVKVNIIYSGYDNEKL